MTDRASVVFCIDEKFLRKDRRFDFDSKPKLEAASLQGPTWRRRAAAYSHSDTTPEGTRNDQLDKVCEWEGAEALGVSCKKTLVTKYMTMV